MTIRTDIKKESPKSIIKDFGAKFYYLTNRFYYVIVTFYFIFKHAKIVVLNQTLFLFFSKSFYMIFKA